jgi:hypothetical protein
VLLDHGVRFLTHSIHRFFANLSILLLDTKAADKNPTVGRLYHHLAILARPNALQQLYYYSRSLTCVKPFPSARKSILTLLDPILGRAVATYSHALPIDTIYIKAHAILFDKLSLDEFEEAMTQFTNNLNNHIGRVTAKWKEQGVYIAVTNVSGWFDYGVDDNIFRQVFLTELYNKRNSNIAMQVESLKRQTPLRKIIDSGTDDTIRAPRKDDLPTDSRPDSGERPIQRQGDANNTGNMLQKDDESEEDGESAEAILAQEATVAALEAQQRAKISAIHIADAQDVILPSVPEEELRFKVNTVTEQSHFPHARRLTNDTFALALRRIGDKNVLPHVHIMLSFLTTFAANLYVSHLLSDTPWVDLVKFLNTLVKTENQIQTQSQNTSQPQDIDKFFSSPVVPNDGERTDELPLPEDYLIRGLIWAHAYFPEKWFEREHDEEERYLELASTVKSRMERVLRLGYKLAIVSTCAITALI